MTDRCQQWQDDGADQIDVNEGVERDAPEAARRRISEPISGQGVGCFVNRQRDQQHPEAEDDTQQIHVEQGAR